MLGPYRIVRELGQGGMGAVFEAEDARVGRKVALKVHLGISGAERFGIEARACARLSHPNLVKVHEVGVANGYHYMALELVVGEALDARIKDGDPLEAREAARIARDLARGLGYAHGQGVLHRDVKPANVLLTPEGAPRLTDFGLAKADDASQALTKTGDLLGTPSYMAPEQADGRSKEADARVDVYALGATLYCLLTGRPPFTASSLPALLTQIMSKAPTPPSKVAASSPAALDRVVLRCLEKEPEARYADMEELAADLDRFLEGELAARRPSRLPFVMVGLGALAVAVGALAWWAAVTRPTPSRSTATPTPTPREVVRVPTPTPTRRARPTPTKAPSSEVPRRRFDPGPENLKFYKKDYAAQLMRPWERRAETGPSARSMIQHAMDYDPDRGVVWLFGGRTRSGYEDDLWSWNGARWIEAPRSKPWPPARANHTVVYDLRRKVLVLFGGREGPGSPEARHVWEWNGTGWKRIEFQPGWPRPRSKAAGTYDARAERVVICGGEAAKGKLLNGLWAWDGTSWRERPLAGPLLPVPRSSTGLLFDGRRLLMLGGYGGRLPGATTLTSGSVWSHDGTVWKLLQDEIENHEQGSGSRSAHTFVWVGDRAFCYGGRVLRLAVKDDETYRDSRFLRRQKWHGLAPPRRPAARSFHGSAYDTKRRRVVVFGGSEWLRGAEEPEAIYRDTWEYAVGKTR